MQPVLLRGAAAPAFEIDTQLIVETGGSIILPAVEVKAFFKTKNLSPFGPFSVANNYSYGNGSEFKYFPFTSANGFPNALMNVTGMGFRIVAKATAGQSWHGVAYIDHMCSDFRPQPTCPPEIIRSVFSERTRAAKLPSPPKLTSCRWVVLTR